MDMFSRYETYADSKIDFIGEIPGHWKVTRIANVFEETRTVNKPDEELLSIDRYKGIIKQTETGRKTRASKDRSAYRMIEPGQLGYNILNAFMGSIGVSRHKGILSPAYAVAKTRKDQNTWYFHYLFRTELYKRQFNRFSYGIMLERNRLYYDRFKTISTIVPPQGEQDQIVAYLRAQDAHIARFIKAKRELIDLLNEQKQTLIHQAVTKGIDHNVGLKPSEIDWLGDIPEHWKTRRLKFIANNVSDQTDAQQEDEVYLALEHVESWSGNFNPLKENVPFASTVKKFKKGDVLFGKLRPYLAKVVQALQNGVCVSEFIVIRVRDKKILNNFLEILLRSKGFIEKVNSSTAGAKMPRTDWTFIGNLQIPLPNSGEQSEIVKAVVHETQSINTAIDRVKKEIELVMEYREKLITDTVTGQIDIRNWQPGPDDNFDDNDLSALNEGNEAADEEDEDETH